MWQILKGNNILGYKFRRQYVFAGYILDFYCQKLKIAVEVDGKIHTIQKNRESDMAREEILKRYGVAIIRITNEEIESNPMEVLRKLKSYIKSMIQEYFL